VPKPERLLDCVFQHGHAHGEERLDGVPVPWHLLALDHPLRDDLIYRRFGEGGRNRLAILIPISSVR
jgi:hypothetical protein